MSARGSLPSIRARSGYPPPLLVLWRGVPPTPPFRSAYSPPPFKIFPDQLGTPQKYFCRSPHRARNIFASTQYEPEKYLGPPPGNDTSHLNAQCLTRSGRAEKKFCLNSDRPNSVRAKKKFVATEIGPENLLPGPRSGRKNIRCDQTWPGKSLVASFDLLIAREVS